MVKTCPKGYSKVYVSRVGSGPKIKGWNFDTIVCEKINSSFKSLVGKTQAQAVKSLRSKGFKCHNQGGKIRGKLQMTTCSRGNTQIDLTHTYVRWGPAVTKRAVVKEIKHTRRFSYTGQ